MGSFREKSNKIVALLHSYRIYSVYENKNNPIARTPQMDFQKKGISLDMAQQRREQVIPLCGPQKLRGETWAYITGSQI